MKDNNRIVVDLNKILHAELYYETFNCGVTYRRHTKPKWATFNGQDVIESDRLYKTGESALSYLTRRGMLDKWYPVLILQASNNHSLRYTGIKAMSIWKEYNRRIFKKNI